VEQHFPSVELGQMQTETNQTPNLEFFASKNIFQMTQALYAHMNNKNTYIFKNENVPGAGG
jgi:hypothetical protein